MTTEDIETLIENGRLGDALNALKKEVEDSNNSISTKNDVTFNLAKFNEITSKFHDTLISTDDYFKEYSKLLKSTIVLVSRLNLLPAKKQSIKNDLQKAKKSIKKISKQKSKTKIKTGNHGIIISKSPGASITVKKNENLRFIFITIIAMSLVAIISFFIYYHSTYRKFNDVSCIGTYAAYSDFISKHPNSQYAHQLKDSLNKAEVKITGAWKNQNDDTDELFFDRKEFTSTDHYPMPGQWKLRDKKLYLFQPNKEPDIVPIDFKKKDMLIIDDSNTYIRIK